MKKILFLDIDGVLNDRTPCSNGYNGIRHENVSHLNDLLDRCPDVKIVLSSSWRYGFLKGWHTLDGVEHLLLTHGINCAERIHGCTEADPIEYAHGDSKDWQQFTPEQWHEWGLKWRGAQIEKYAAEHGCDHYVILDDLPLKSPWLVQTDGRWGMRRVESVAARAMFLRGACRDCWQHKLGGQNDFRCWTCGRNSDADHIADGQIDPIGRHA